MHYRKGQKLAETHYDGKNNLNQIVRYEYDSLNNPTKITFENPQRKIVSYETAAYEYENNTYIYRVYNASGKLKLEQVSYCHTDTTNIIRNEFGELIRTIPGSNSPQYMGYSDITYDYDEYRNWIKRKTIFVSEKGKSTSSIARRKIEYLKTK